MQLIYELGGVGARPIGPDELTELYRHPVPEAGGWLRSNFVSTLDGSIQGPDGRSGSINTTSDQQIFAIHRALADAVVVAGGTARHEGYRAIDLAPWQQQLRLREGLAPHPTLVIVTRSADLNPTIAAPAEGEGGPVVVVTTVGKTATELAPLRAAGIEVMESAADEIDLGRMVDDLAGRGLSRLLCEGGPHLHRDLLAAGLVAELSLTLAPVAVGGEGLRTTTGAALDPIRNFELQFVLLGDDGALFLSYRRAAIESVSD